MLNSQTVIDLKRTHGFSGLPITIMKSIRWSPPAWHIACIHGFRPTADAHATASTLWKARAVGARTHTPGQPGS